MEERERGQMLTERERAARHFNVNVTEVTPDMIQQLPPRGTGLETGKARGAEEKIMMNDSIKEGNMPYTQEELKEITEIMYNTASQLLCNVFDGRGLPICRQWEHLSAFEQCTAVENLKERIEKETLQGYFARKKREKPEAQHIYDETIRNLAHLYHG